MTLNTNQTKLEIDEKIETKNLKMNKLKEMYIKDNKTTFITTRKNSNNK